MSTLELIDSIRVLLDGRTSSISSEVLALEYAKQCCEVNERLVKISLMLESGGEIQALQLAEQAPRVVDTALALSFGGESAWQEFCHNHGHEVAPLVDARTLEALLAIQDKGIASNHPLYKDYRAAVSSRNDGQAHELIRVIVRMNPGDENAAKELKRLQRKALLAALTSLQANLNADDETLLAAMDKVEACGMAEDYEQTPEWKQAIAIRDSIHRASAWKRMPEALAHAGALLKTGDWRQAAALHAEYSVLAATYGINQEAHGMSDRALGIEQELERHRAEAERIAQARNLVLQMEQIADEVETQIVTPQGLSDAFAAPMAEDLARKLRKLEGLRGEFPNNSKVRIESAHAQLVQTLERSDRSKRLRLISGLVALVVVLLTATGIGVLVFRASAQADLLNSLRSKQASSGVRDLLNQIKNKEPILMHYPRLSTEMAQASNWLAAMDADHSLVDHELSALEEARHNEFTNLSSSDLFSKLQETGAVISKLPSDMTSEPSTRLTLLRNDGERVLMKRQEKNDDIARKLAAQWTENLGKIDFNSPAKLADAIIKSANEELDPLLKLASNPAPILRLPASTETMVADVNSRIQQVQEKVGAVSAALATLKEAETGDAYRKAISQLADCNFSEGIMAQRVRDAWPDDDRVKAFLVFRGDLSALKAASNDTSENTPMPEAAVALDREVISELSSSEVLNKLWEVVWKNSKGMQQNSLSDGELVHSGENDWKGKLAPYPKLTSDTLKFKETFIHPYEGNVLISSQPSPTAAMMSHLGLSRLLDDTGTKFRSSVLPLIDTVANDTKAKPLAKAYVLSQLLRLLRNHKSNEWGLYYCPSMIDDIKRMDELRMKVPLLESSWLLEKAPDNAEAYEKFFFDRGKKSSYDEMQKTRAAAAVAIGHSVDLAGKVTAEGTIALTPAPVKRLILTLCELENGAYQLKLCGIADARVSEFQSPLKVLPFSPVLSITLPEETQKFLLAIHQNSASANLNPQKP